MTPEWVSAYIGLPYANRGRGPHGWDCWGLVQLVLSDHFEWVVPSYEHEYLASNDGDSVAAVITRELQHFRRLPSAEVGAIVILRIAGRPTHCGVMVDRERMLHTLNGTASCLERIDGARWNRRIDGFYGRALL